MTGTLSTPSVDPLVGQLVTGRYRVLGRLGEGGMGTVYLAIHEAIEKKVALKVLHREYSANAEVIERFQQEAISASRIKHPNVIDVFDFGQLGDGSCFIAMEFLEGQDLGELLTRVGTLEPEDALAIVLQIARALGLAHSRGVVHRDLKPENVFLQQTPEGERVVKIVDFGIAQLRGKEDGVEQGQRRRRLTKTGMIFGTPEYMAPEQARGLEVDARTDIYATGVILYELLTGAVPFVGDSFLDVLNQHVREPIPPLVQKRPSLQLSQALTDVVGCMLAKRPDDRYPSMKDLARAVSETPEGRAVRAGLASSAGGELPVDSEHVLVDLRAPEAASAVRVARTISGPPAPPERGGAPLTSILGSQAAALLEPPREHLSKKSAMPLAFGLLTAGLVIAGVSGWMVLAKGRQKPPAASPQGGRPPENGRSDAALREKVPPNVEAPAMPPPAAPLPSAAATKNVVLRLTTVPAGAMVEKNGFQVCDHSPCEVTAQPDEAVTLVARKGRMTGKARVLAQRDQAVSITLHAAASAPAKLCEVVVDGLKILRPCR